ncbi:MAG: TIGR03862 family flavoprotein [Hyphomicrobiales bacterium]
MAHVVVVGAGPAGLMAAEIAARADHTVTIFERMPSPARKFLMAGLGGLNITHAGALDEFLASYFHLPDHLKAAIRAFPPDALRAWAEELEEPVFVGSSGKMFPKCFKTSPLLRKWLRRLDQNKVELLTRHKWVGFEGGSTLKFQTPNKGIISQSYDAAVFSMGGASWPRLGGDGAWLSLLESYADVVPFEPSNMGINVDWSDHLRSKHAGAPLKSIAISCQGQTVASELLLTNYGLEGSAIYAMSAHLRECLRDKPVELSIDLRPGQSEEKLAGRLERVPAKQSLSNCLRRALKFSPAETALVYEVGSPPSDSQLLAKHIKHLPLKAKGIQGLDRAISSAGGIKEQSLTEHFMIRNQPGLFVAGEMLDFDAPTGGYLLQACLSSGWQAGQGVVQFLAQPND